MFWYIIAFLGELGLGFVLTSILFVVLFLVFIVGLIESDLEYQEGKERLEQFYE